MLTPVRSIFHCEQQTGYEWLFAVLAGAGSLLVAFATKLLTRCTLAPHSSDCLAHSLTTHSMWLITRLCKCIPRRWSNVLPWPECDTRYLESTMCTTLFPCAKVLGLCMLHRVATRHCANAGRRASDSGRLDAEQSSSTP